MAAVATYLMGSFNTSPLDKMGVILAEDIFNCIFLNENDKLSIQISLTWCRTGDKPLPEPIMTHLTDA